MNKKTEEKIEAMAESYSKGNDWYGGSPQEIVECSVHKGAAPWAEWCERFALTLQVLESETYDDLSCSCCASTFVTAQSIVKEYRQWLGER